MEQLRTLMNETASKLPEYPVVMAMKGVGPSLGPQLMAEIGDVTRFTHKGAITAFAGVDPVSTILEIIPRKVSVLPSTVRPCCEKPCSRSWRYWSKPNRMMPYIGSWIKSDPKASRIMSI